MWFDIWVGFGILGIMVDRKWSKSRNYSPASAFLYSFHSRARFRPFCHCFCLFLISFTCTYTNTITNIYLAIMISFWSFGSVFDKEKVCVFTHTKIPQTKVFPCPHAMSSTHAFEIKNFRHLFTNFEKLQNVQKRLRNH